MAAYAFRQLQGAGSIPVHGSNKTNDEVVAKLLTWKWRARKTSSSQDRQGNLSVLFIFHRARLREILVLDAGGSRSLVRPINLRGLPQSRYSVLLPVTKRAG